MHWLRERFLNAGRITEDDLGDAGKPARATFFIGPPGSTPDEPHRFTDVGWLAADGLTHQPDATVDGFQSLQHQPVRTLVTSTPMTFELKFVRTDKNRAAWRENLRVVFGFDRVRGRRHRAMVRKLLGVGRLDNRKHRAARLRGLHHLERRKARSALHAAYHARQRSRRRA